MTQKPPAHREELAISDARAYTSPDVTVFYDRERCLHFAECVRGLPDSLRRREAAVDPASERLSGAGGRGRASLPEWGASLSAAGSA